jgi:hypothetical protein
VEEGGEAGPGACRQPVAGEELRGGKISD